MKEPIFDQQGLLPAIVQDASTRVVLMLGYMNEESLRVTRQTGRVCFYSRSRRRLWTKGEESGHFLHVKEILVDCDGDALLVKAIPVGPTCHTGADTCWNEENLPGFLVYLQEYLRARALASPDASYTARLFRSGINKVAQKVGEEAVELVIEAMRDDDALFLEEAADLLYHYLLLLLARDHSLEDVVEVLKRRHRPAPGDASSSPVS
ncbi:MAG: bifunctional phosphoribosyl-AMP cyclohydrolase/phosphoribosyl-ATP diphosphatase HisIE [Odoribacteraceae bacterium]|jgi:phosphoribosyl-ATP pyrophosphohydrolase/phosphoribosyl-AMP cyclohydrolase|nr:bifunctional phosphoribosyl-AMP cyclohydrolase/phosphoribosyl-ATP diphosphatase HisIE [Odoribacteraceae bacterium]